MGQIESVDWFLKEYFTHNSNPMWIYDPFSLRFLAVNKAAVKALGYTEKEFLDMTIQELLSQEEIQQLAYTSIYEGMAPDTESYIQYVSKDGISIWVKISINEVDFKNKKAKIVTAIDITDRKKAEFALFENEDRFKLVTKATFDAIWDWDLENNIIYRGEGYQSLFGYNTGKIVMDSTTWEDLIHKEDCERVIKSFQNVLNSEFNNWTEEYRYLKADGNYTHIRDRGIIIRNSNGKAIRMVGAKQDINDQIQRENKLKLFESAVANTTDSVIITDARSRNSDGLKIIYLNEAFTKMTGYSLEDLEGKTPKLLQGPLSDQSELLRLKKAIKNWSPCEIEIINYKKNGNPFWVNISIVPFANNKGNFTHWIGIQKDVSDRRIRTQEMEHLVQELTKNNIELKQFSYITTHNLRAPLTNMLGIFGILDTSLFLDERTNKLINGLKESTLKLNETLNDLIRILVVKENKKMELTIIHFQSILDNVIKSIQNTITQSNAVIETNFYSAERVVFNKVYMESILLNLITNAIKYKKPNVNPNITIKTSILNDCVQLHVIDNGMGMNWEKVKSKIFGLYQKFHSNSDGKGIGLYLVHAQITALGGTIEMETQENLGTAFTITFKRE